MIDKFELNPEKNPYTTFLHLEKFNLLRRVLYCITILCDVARMPLVLRIRCRFETKFLGSCHVQQSVLSEGNIYDAIMNKRCVCDFEFLYPHGHNELRSF